MRGACPLSGKTRYQRAEAVKRAKQARRFTGVVHSEYRCECGWWHYGSADDFTARAARRRSA